MVLPRFSHRINYAEINLKFQGTSLKGFGKNESKLVVSTQIMYLNKNSNNVSKFAFKLSACLIVWVLILQQIIHY
jgi:hypothetical protein